MTTPSPFTLSAFGTQRPQPRSAAAVFLAPVDTQRGGKGGEAFEDIADRSTSLSAFGQAMMQLQLQLGDGQGSHWLTTRGSRGTEAKQAEARHASDRAHTAAASSTPKSDNSTVGVDAARSRGVDTPHRSSPTAPTAASKALQPQADPGYTNAINPTAGDSQAASASPVSSAGSAAHTPERAAHRRGVQPGNQPQSRHANNNAAPSAPPAEAPRTAPSSPVTPAGSPTPTPPMTTGPQAATPLAQAFAAPTAAGPGRAGAPPLPVPPASASTSTSTSTSTGSGTGTGTQTPAATAGKGVAASGPSAASTASTSSNAPAVAVKMATPAAKEAAGKAATPSPSDNAKAGKDADAVNSARLSRALGAALAQKGGRITLRLTPSEIGTVRIDLNVKQQSVDADLRASSPAAQRLLQTQLTQLRAALEAQGLQVNRLNVQLLPTYHSTLDGSPPPTAGDRAAVAHPTPPPSTQSPAQTTNTLADDANDQERHNAADQQSRGRERSDAQRDPSSPRHADREERATSRRFSDALQRTAFEETPASQAA